MKTALEQARNDLYESVMDYSTHELREVYIDTHSDVDVLLNEQVTLEMCKEDNDDEERIKETEARCAHIEDEIRQKVNAIDPSGKICTELRVWMQAHGLKYGDIKYLFDWTLMWHQNDKQEG